MRHGLTSYWITGTHRFQKHSIGVTAWSVDDALALIREAKFEINADDAEIKENVFPHDIRYRHVWANSGPAFFRGIWYPCLNIGWGASGQH